MQEITIALPETKQFNEKLIKSTRATVMRLSAEYRRLGDTQGQAMTKAWRDVHQMQEQARQSMQMVTQEAVGQFGGLGQVLQGFMQKIAEIAQAIAGLFGFGKKNTLDKLVSSTKTAAKTAKSTAATLAKAVLSIDELNVLEQSRTATTGGSSGSSGSTGNKEDIEPDLDQWTGFLDFFKTMLEQLNALFWPSITAWRNAFILLGRTAKEAWQTMKASVLDLWNTALVPLGEYILLDFIPNVVNTFSKTFAPIVANLGRVFLEEFALNFQLACYLIGDIINTYLLPLFQLLQQMIIDALNGISESWRIHGETLVEHIRNAGENIRELIMLFYYDILKPILDEIMEQLNLLWNHHLKPLWDQLTLFFWSLCDLCLTLWNEFVAPLLKKFMESFGPILVEVMEWVVRRFSDGIAIMSDVISDLIQLLYGLSEFIIGAFTGDWHRAWTGIETSFKNVWQSMKNIAFKTVNGIIDTVNGMIRAITAGINAIIDKINKVGMDVPGWIPEFGGIHLGFNIPHMTAPQIPALAQGAVLPANKPFLAMVGDQKRGTNVEAPLETIQQALAAVLAQTGSVGGVVRQPIEIKLDGQVLYRAMAEVEERQGVKIGGAFANAY